MMTEVSELKKILAQTRGNTAEHILIPRLSLFDILSELILLKEAMPLRDQQQFDFIYATCAEYATTIILEVMDAVQPTSGLTPQEMIVIFRKCFTDAIATLPKPGNAS